MKNMITESDKECPFEFNFDPETFKPGDIVSYQVPEEFDDMPFVGELIEVAADHVILKHFGLPEKESKLMSGTRESRPKVSAKDALG